MIIPFINGIIGFRRVPVTWCLFLLNVLVFVFTYQLSDKYQTEIERLIDDDNYSRYQGLLFSRYIQDNPSRYPASYTQMASLALNSSADQRREMMGGLAMRDSHFLSQAAEIDWAGDQVLRSWWKEKFLLLNDYKNRHPSYMLGITESEFKWDRFITYQFSHSGIEHLVGNMLFLLIFSSAVELMVGGLGLLVVYLFSGAFAGLFFLLMQDASAIPLIGASGAVSGIMAFFCVYMGQRGVRYIYFLFWPSKGYAGIVYLPAWVTLILWAASDLSGLMATPAAFGGVAYTAHLGGEICGALAALILIVLRKTQNKELLPVVLPIDSKSNFTQL